MSSRKPWAPLDFDWFEDEKVMELRARLGVRGELAWARLIGIWADFSGARIDLNAVGTRAKLRRKLERSDKQMEQLFEEMADIGLISGELWEMGIVTCNRAADEAHRREKRREGGAAGGKKSGAARKAKSAAEETKES
ncbi:MAG: DUF4373 domain-containing protein [Eggerthellaceae bacterium]|nr:DUF4373 domain-containing protein [Eggerthellaceae bacterium]